MAVATKKAAAPKTSGGLTAKSNYMDAKKVKAGDIVKIEYWTKVIGTGTTSKGDHILKVQDMYDPTNRFAVEGKDLIDTCVSADQFAKEEELTMTDLAKKFVYDCNKVPFCAGFFKDNGEFRIARGKRYEDDEHLLGMSKYDDYDVQEDYRTRQINHRTIQFLIFENVRYVLKGAKRSTWKLPDGTVVK